MNKFGVFVAGMYFHKKVIQFANWPPVKAAVIKASNDLVVACQKSDAKRKEEMLGQENDICVDSETKDESPRESTAFKNIVEDLEEVKEERAQRKFPIITMDQLNINES